MLTLKKFEGKKLDSTYLIVFAISLLPTIALTKHIAYENKIEEYEGGWSKWRPNYLLGVCFSFYIPCLLMAGVSFFKNDGLIMMLIAIPVIAHISIFSLSYILGRN